MPKFERHASDISRARPHKEPGQRDSAAVRSQAIEPPANTQELQQPWESLLAGAVTQGTFEHHATVLGDGRLSNPRYAQQRANFVRQLQRDYANQYVQRLVSHIQYQRAEAVQTKITVGPAGDNYEQEADRVAKQVVGMISSTTDEPTTQPQQDEEELQM